MKRLTTATALSIVALACQPDQAVNPDTEFRVQQPNRGRQTIDDKLAALSDEIPGFGGMYYDSTKTLVLQLTDVSQISDARLRAGAWFGAKPDRWSRSIGVEDAGRARAQQATFNYRQLNTWFKSVSADILGLDGIWGGAISSRRNRIIVWVNDQTALPRIEAELALLDIPEGAVETVFRPGEIVGARSTSVRDKVRPTIGGLQITGVESGWTCTLGYNVSHSTTSSWYFLTNSHCTSDAGNTQTTDTQGQNDGITSEALGDERSDPDTFTNSTNSGCPVGYDCRYSDAALFKHTGPSSNYHHAYMAWPNEGNLTYTTEKNIQIEADPIEGLDVHKVGRTSGRSVSNVDDECATVTHGSLGWKMLCQILTDDDDANIGDSGSPVVYPFTGSSYLVAAGLLWGVDTLNNVMAASNISYTLDEIEDDFGGILCVKLSCSPDPSVFFTGPTVIPEEVSCTWQAYASGGVPGYTYSWTGVATGSGSSLQAEVTSSGWLTVTVTDYVNHTDYYSLYITIDEYATGEGCVE